MRSHTTKQTSTRAHPYSAKRNMKDGNKVKFSEPGSRPSRRNVVDHFKDIEQVPKNVRGVTNRRGMRKTSHAVRDEDIAMCDTSPSEEATTVTKRTCLSDLDTLMMQLAFAIPLEGRGNDILSKMVEKVQECKNEVMGFQKQISYLESRVFQLEQESVKRKASQLGSPFSYSDASSSFSSPSRSPNNSHVRDFDRSDSPLSPEVLDSVANSQDRIRWRAVPEDMDERMLCKSPQTSAVDASISNEPECETPTFYSPAPLRIINDDDSIEGLLASIRTVEFARSGYELGRDAPSFYETEREIDRLSMAMPRMWTLTESDWKQQNRRTDQV